MYQVMYKRVGTPEAASNFADDWLGVVLGDAIIVAAIMLMPDGMVMQRDGAEWLETYRGQLRPVEAGITVTKKRGAA